jgi:hypothetical protein
VQTETVPHWIPQLEKRPQRKCTRAIRRLNGPNALHDLRGSGNLAGLVADDIARAQFKGADRAPVSNSVMKFCYVDESGMGRGPVIVMVGVIVDVQRAQDEGRLG